MTVPSPWKSFYKAFPDGRGLITRAALMAFEIKHDHRVLRMTLHDSPEKILLLDKPLLVGPLLKGGEIEEHPLYRVRLRDLPGWPPRPPPRASWPAGFELPLSRMKSVGFKRRQSAALPRVEFELEHLGRETKALLVGPPTLLLKCVEATLTQEGALGRRLIDLEEMRLVGPE